MKRVMNGRALFGKAVSCFASFALVMTMFVAVPAASAQASADGEDAAAATAATENVSSAENSATKAANNEADAEDCVIASAIEDAGESESVNSATQEKATAEIETADIYADELPSGIELNESKNGTDVVIANADPETNAAYLYDVSKKISDGDKDLAAADITLNANPNMSGITWIPLGTKSNPYTGTFDGNNKTISNLSISGTEYVGFFGCIGAGGKVKNLTVTGAKVTAESAEKVIRCIGVVAGYAYGDVSSGAYVFENVKVVNSSVIAKSTFPVESAEMDNVEDPFGDIAEGKSEDAKVVEYVGGIAGYCAGSMKDCTLTGDNDETSLVSIEARQSPKAGYSTIGKSVGGLVGQLGGYVIVHTIKDEGDDESHNELEPQYPSGDGKYTRTAATHELVNCIAEEATVKVLADGEGSPDRFGEQTTSYFKSVGGLVGYGMASISNCKNTATVNAPQGDGVGGIVGSLRALVYSGSSSATSDAGSYKAEGEERLGTEHALMIYRCTNKAAITGLHAVGGIEGGGGTYTSIRECANLSSGEDEKVIGMRWNKPMPGGIAGQTYGDILLCYSKSIVTTETGSGFYAAGIVGATARFIKSMGDEFDSSEPEIASCYSTGAIESGAAYKQGGICGSNEGYIHDCYYITGNTQNGKAIAESGYGTVQESTVKDISSDEMKKSSALLNACLKTADFTKENAGYFFSEDEKEYPVLNWMSSYAPTSVAGATINQDGTGQASYTTSQNPVPKLTLTLGSTQLVQNVDYYVLPDESVLDENGKCRDVYGASSIADTTFKATIVGIGKYSGTNSTEFSYKVGKGDFSECTAIIKTKKYNAKEQWMSEEVDESGNGDLVVKDGTGDIVSRSSYIFPTKPVKFVTKSGKRVAEVDTSAVKNYRVTTEATSYDKKSHIGYQVEITANEDSNYTGSTYGFFVISKSHLLGSDFYYAEASEDTTGQYALLDCNGKKYYFDPGDVADAKTEARLYSLDENGEKVYGLSVPYLGEAYTSKLLTVNAMYLKDSETGEPYYRLVQSKDFRVVYGDPVDPTDVISTDAVDANLNVTSDVAGKRACITIRYIVGNDRNFTNYANLFFTITKADISTQCTVSVANNYEYTGKAPTVVVKGMTGAVIPSSNYTVTCTSSTYGPGTFNVTITGKNNLTGSITKTVTAKKPVTNKVKKISKIKVGKKKIKVSWKGVTGATGYKIAYKVKGSKKWKYTTSKSKSKTIKGLKKGKSYQVKVCAFKKPGKKYYYGKYCSAKISGKVK